MKRGSIPCVEIGDLVQIATGEVFLVVQNPFCDEDVSLIDLNDFTVKDSTTVDFLNNIYVGSPHWIYGEPVETLYKKGTPEWATKWKEIANDRPMVKVYQPKTLEEKLQMRREKIKNMILKTQERVNHLLQNLPNRKGSG